MYALTACTLILSLINKFRGDHPPLKKDFYPYKNNSIVAIL